LAGNVKGAPGTRVSGAGCGEISVGSEISNDGRASRTTVAADWSTTGISMGTAADTFGMGGGADGAGMAGGLAEDECRSIKRR
jgi:hypothetical protein